MALANPDLLAAAAAETRDAGGLNAPELPFSEPLGDNRRVTEATNLSGLWLGSFSYPAGAGPTTPFLAKLIDSGGSLSGEIAEPNVFGPGTLEAFVAGTRSGAGVDFTKTYDGASDCAHSVDYVGRVSEDGNAVTGVWSMEGMDGTFEMYREAVWEEAEGKEAEVAEL